MKKLLIGFMIILFLSVSFTAYAENPAGNVVGQIYSTDILTFVNQKPIQGYNIGGRTVVIAEDLEGYGFSLDYHDELRMLSIYSDFTVGNINPAEIQRGKVGQILGNVYETDITTYYNGIPIPGYNIGGRTAICLEDLGDITDSPNAHYGYSNYLGKSVWNEENRSISYTSFLENAQDIVGIPGISLCFSDNVISVRVESDSSYVQEEFLGWYGYSPGTGMSKYYLNPLYFDNHGEQVEVGCAVSHPTHTGGFALIYIENPEEVLGMIKTYLLP